MWRLEHLLRPCEPCAAPTGEPRPTAPAHACRRQRHRPTHYRRGGADAPRGGPGGQVATHWSPLLAAHPPLRLCVVTTERERTEAPSRRHTWHALAADPRMARLL